MVTKPKPGSASTSTKGKKEIACPQCGSTILDVSKGPEMIRCIVCKHIFEVETEESKLRKGKEVPHRIRKKASLMGLLKKIEEIPEEEEDEEEEDEEGESKKKKKKAPQFKAIRTKQEKTKIMVIMISLGLMIFFFILAALNGITIESKNADGEIEEKPILPSIVFQENQKVTELQDEQEYVEKFYVQLDWLAFVMLGMICGFGPIGIYESSRNSKILKLEERLADFLRDLAESSRSGQTLHEAIYTASGGEYGELLPEIQQMSVQISWGVSATEALERFAQRVNTPLVKRAVTLINEASSAGGDVSKVLEAAANDTKELQMLNRERKIQMSLYVAVIFVSFMVFLVVILIVYATFVPQMKLNAVQQEMKQESGDEEEGGLGAAQTGASFSPVGVDFDGIKLVFIFAALVHAIGDGVVAGLMGSGRITDGLKFSFVMVIIVFVIFVFMMPGASIG
jgi:flagellar protein FlaJ